MKLKGLKDSIGYMGVRKDLQREWWFRSQLFFIADSRFSRERPCEISRVSAECCRNPYYWE